MLFREWNTRPSNEHLQRKGGSKVVLLLILTLPF